ncbi:MAG TPA: peptide chain release factor 2 [Spirochaetota bacterium]|nr:peptide chain release factor 2 [Spirochaetota bacterium]
MQPVAEKDYQESLREIEALQAKVNDLYASINVDALRSKLAALEAKASADDAWQDRERLATLNREISALKKRIEPWDRLMGTIGENRELMEIALAESDEGVLAETAGSLGALAAEFDRIETIELLSGEDDLRDCFVTVRPGAGGTESQDWASMLFRMYLRWAEDNGYRASVIDYTPGDEAGVKSATVNVQGDYAYGFLKGERGVHRLVRISPFDANKRRHTSFASVEVVPEVADDIAIDINESDLRIDTYRSSGAGGQHVNTTDSAVRITHLPTGIVTQCQNERSQHKNKAFAMKVLRAKIYELKREEMDRKREEKAGEKKDISWGNQIRSYVFQPYMMVKDHRTGEETSSVDSVMDGAIDRFIYAYLKNRRAAG